MRLSFLGDSFDIVKQSLLRWLSACGPWSVHPMFTERFTSEDVEAFVRLIGVPVISQEVLGMHTDRAAYFAAARECETHLFLDPDTGLRLKKRGGKSAPSYLFGQELVLIVESRPRSLTLVFDQSVARGKERQQLEVKLSALAAEGLHGAAYVSHACFLMVGHDGDLVKKAVQVLQDISGLPSGRFIERTASADDPYKRGTLLTKLNNHI